MRWNPRQDYTIQKENVRVADRQYRVTIVTTPDDRWCVIEANPERLKQFIHKTLVAAIGGKCRLLW